MKEEKKERIAKVLARAGVCSRRDAERMIEAGRVAVNGEVLTTPAFLVAADDALFVDGKPVGGAEETRLFLYHKPAGLVTTAHDDQGRPTVFDNLPPGLPRVISIGRLDMNTEGLLLLTNDGELSRHLELPATGWVRCYRVRAYGQVTDEHLAQLAAGITYEGIHYGPIEATLDREQGSNSWLTLSLREGKNREIRNVMRALGLHVNRLIRTSYGPFQLSDLTQGEAVEVPRKILRQEIKDFFKARERG